MSDHDPRLAGEVPTYRIYDDKGPIAPMTTTQRSPAMADEPTPPNPPLVRTRTGWEQVQSYIQLVGLAITAVVATGVITQTEAVRYAKWPILIGVGILVLLQFISSFLTPAWKAWRSEVNVPSEPREKLPEFKP